MIQSPSTTLTQRFLERPWLAFILLGSFFLLFLGRAPLGTPDEARYSQIPSEMLQSGNFITPHLNGLPYFEKPPLTYWLTAISFRIFGLSPWSARLPLAIFGFLGCLGVFLFARRFIGLKEASSSVLALGTAPLYAAMSRLLTLDLIFSVILSAGLLSFYSATQTQQRQRTLFLFLYGLFLGLSVLSKGLTGLAIAGPTILLWIVWQRNWSCLWTAFHPLTIGTFFLVSAPWFIKNAMLYKDFLWFFFIREHFLRYTTQLHDRFKPFWFFFPTVIWGFFPWIALLVKEEPKENCVDKSLTAYLWIWFGWTLFFFSLNQSKLIPYILPALTPLALIVSPRITQLSFKLPSLRVSSLYVTTTLLFGIAFPLLWAAGWIKPTTGLPDATAALKMLCWVMPSIAVFIGIIAYLFRKRTHFLLIVLSGQLTFLLTAIYIRPYVQRERSIAPLAQHIKRIPSTPPVITYGFYPHDLTLYLKRAIGAWHYDEELWFGQHLSPHKKILYNTPDVQELCSKEPVVLFVARAEKEAELCQQLAHIEQKYPASICSIIRRFFPYILAMKAQRKPDTQK